MSLGMPGAGAPPDSWAEAASAAVRGTLEVPRTPAAAAQACVALTERITQLLGAAFERVGGEEPIACRPGCSFCCHLRVMVYPHEAIALAAYVRGLPDEEGVPLKQRLLDAAAQRQALDPSEPFPAMACPFLTAGPSDRLADGFGGGRCRVYERRPAACAGYHSLQRGACERRYEMRGGSVGIPVSRALQEAAVTVHERLGRAVTELGLAAGQVELATAVAALLQRPALVEQWLAGGEWPRDGRGLVPNA